MFDLKGIHLVLDQLAEERGIPREKMLEAVEGALATAYKKEYGKRGQIVRATFAPDTGEVDFYQVKTVVDRNAVRMDDGEEAPAKNGGSARRRRRARALQRGATPVP